MSKVGDYFFEFPAPRRAAVPGCQTCASCQEEIEMKKKVRGF